MDESRVLKTGFGCNFARNPWKLPSRVRGQYRQKSHGRTIVYPEFSDLNLVDRAILSSPSLALPPSSPRNNEFFSLDRNPKKREREGIGNRVNSRQLRRDLVFDVSSLLRETRRRRVRPTLARNINEEAGGREGSGRRRKSVIIPTLGRKSNDVSARKRGGRKETVVFQGSEATGKKRERESLSEFGRSASAGGASKQRCVSKRSIFS